MSNSKYKATITVNGKSKHLKCWPTACEAALVYDQAAREYFGEFAFFNFPQRSTIDYHREGRDSQELAQLRGRLKRGRGVAN